MRLSKLVVVSAVAGLVAARRESLADTYIPYPVPCPANKSLIREASDISKEEQDWVSSRHTQTDEALLEFLERANLTDFEAQQFIENDTYDSIHIGLAFSGGGYRAMLCGAGQLSALDSRVNGSNEHGLGGLFQASTYLTGLSGGSWLVGSLALNNYPSVDEIVQQNDLWNLENSLLLPFGELKLLQDIVYWFEIISQVQDKYNAGYNTSIVDYWARALSSKFFRNGSTGLQETWSGIRDLPFFSDHSLPFPIIVADGRYPGSKIINENSTVFEINPFEIGSWDPALYSFFDVKYLGSNLTDGKPYGNYCVNGYDNAGLMMGTSSSIFNAVNVSSISGLSTTFQLAITEILSQLELTDTDIALYEPNPFYQTSYGTGNQSISKSETLYLVDGGEDGQGIPYAPLIQPEREVDIIFSFDNDGDTENWPNGAAVISTYEREMFGEQRNTSAFPIVPDTTAEFEALNLTARPVFFGCYDDQLPKSGSLPPIVVYTANRPFSYMSNTSTFMLNYSETERNSMFQNGFEVASRYNLTLDSEYNACVGCAIIKRQSDRMGIPQTEQCKNCFERYCWDGKASHQAAGSNYTWNGLTNSSSPLPAFRSNKSSSLKGPHVKINVY